MVLSFDRCIIRVKFMKFHFFYLFSSCECFHRKRTLTAKITPWYLFCTLKTPDFVIFIGNTQVRREFLQKRQKTIWFKVTSPLNHCQIQLGKIILRDNCWSLQVYFSNIFLKKSPENWEKKIAAIIRQKEKQVEVLIDCFCLEVLRKLELTKNFKIILLVKSEIKGALNYDSIFFWESYNIFSFLGGFFFYWIWSSVFAEDMKFNH